jgi:hypothetical protein
MDLRMPFKNCEPFKVASRQDYGSSKIVQYTGLCRIGKHVSGHFWPQYVLILLGDTGLSAKIGGFQPAGMADIGQKHHARSRSQRQRAEHLTADSQ